MLYNSMENKSEKYWVGIKYWKRLRQSKDIFKWDNGRRVSDEESKELQKIMDRSSVSVILIYPYCIAITREDELKPMHCSKELSYVCQTDANATTSPPSVAITTSFSTESAATTTSLTTASTAKVTSKPTSSATEVTSKPASSITKKKPEISEASTTTPTKENTPTTAISTKPSAITPRPLTGTDEK
ncbi:hypothetical protein AC249_AIPGENE16790, partial [Exaiptasia diaphana]